MKWRGVMGFHKKSGCFEGEETLPDRSLSKRGRGESGSKKIKIEILANTTPLYPSQFRS